MNFILILMMFLMFSLITITASAQGLPAGLSSQYYGGSQAYKPSVQTHKK
jgi:hypothetical protein